MVLYIVAVAIVFLASIIAFFVLNGKTGEVKNMKMVGFLLLFAVIMSACGFIGLSSAATSSIVYFFALQFVFLLLGYLMCFLLKKNIFGEFAPEQLSRVLFVIANAALGIIGFTLIFNHFSLTDLAPYYSVSIITFVLPQFLATSFGAFASIPQEIYKVWYFPEEEKEIDYDKIDTNNLYALTIEFSKSINDNHIVNSVAKAPVGMVFGDWFMSFIENYNRKFDQEPIQYVDNNNMPNGWIFYMKPSFFGTPQYIDPDLTITGNRIKEKKVIIARRVGLV